MNDDFIMPFGKHSGQRLEDIPVSYLDWLIGQDWMEEKRDLKETIEAHLESRPDWEKLDED